MNNNTCVAFMLFYIFRHYKRINITHKRCDLIYDMKICKKLLKHMKTNIASSKAYKLAQCLVTRINNIGGNMEVSTPLRFVDYYDNDIILIMTRITNEILFLAHSPFYKRHTAEIFKRFIVLHNLPRVLLSNTSGDASVSNSFHMSKQDAINCIVIYLGRNYI